RRRRRGRARRGRFDGSDREVSAGAVLVLVSLRFQRDERRGVVIVVMQITITGAYSNRRIVRIANPAVLVTGRINLKAPVVSGEGPFGRPGFGGVPPPPEIAGKGSPVGARHSGLRYCDTGPDGGRNDTLARCESAGARRSYIRSVGDSDFADATEVHVLVVG